MVTNEKKNDLQLGFFKQNSYCFIKDQERLEIVIFVHHVRSRGRKLKYIDLLFFSYSEASVFTKQ